MSLTRMSPLQILRNMLLYYTIILGLTRNRLFTPGRIGLKFDIFKLMFYEILVMHIHNSHLIYNFYEQAIKLFL